MLIKYKGVRPKKGVNRPFVKCFHECGVFRNFFQRGGIKFRHIFKRIFFRQNYSIVKRFENKKGFRGSGNMLTRKSFENLHTVVAILVLFENFQANFG